MYKKIKKSVDNNKFIYYNIYCAKGHISPDSSVGRAED